MSIDDFVDHLYTYLYVYMVVSGIMARLYWRIKQAGRWTWKPLVGKRFTSEEIARELIVYQKCLDPEGEEE